MKNRYLEMICSFERLHRLFFEIISSELTRLKITDLNSVQALLVYNTGGNVLSVGEITARGYYLGTNVSYNLKKIIACGYMQQTPSEYDKRSSLIKLSKKGLQLYHALDEAFNQQAVLAKKEVFSDIDSLADLLNKCEMFFGKLVLKNSRGMISIER